MKIEIVVDPVIRMKERRDEIQIYGCIQTDLHFMLKWDGTQTIQEMQDLAKDMCKAAVNVIESKNKEGLMNVEESSQET